MTEVRILPRGAMAEPIRYCLNQWRTMCRFVEDGRLLIDNNLAERVMLPFAVGRKYWLFVQTEVGARPPRSSRAWCKRLEQLDSNLGPTSAMCCCGSAPSPTTPS